MYAAPADAAEVQPSCVKISELYNSDVSLN